MFLLLQFRIVEKRPRKRNDFRFYSIWICRLLENYLMAQRKALSTFSDNRKAKTKAFFCFNRQRYFSALLFLFECFLLNRIPSSRLLCVSSSWFIRFFIDQIRFFRHWISRSSDEWKKLNPNRTRKRSGKKKEKKIYSNGIKIIRTKNQISSPTRHTICHCPKPLLFLCFSFSSCSRISIWTMASASERARESEINAKGKWFFFLEKWNFSVTEPNKSREQRQRNKIKK